MQSDEYKDKLNKIVQIIESWQKDFALLDEYIEYIENSIETDEIEKELCRVRFNDLKILVLNYIRIVTQRAGFINDQLCQLINKTEDIKVSFPIFKNIIHKKIIH